MNLEKMARLRFAHLPTPLEEMPRLSKALGGPRLFIKRDDQTGLASGGNKARKLEFLVADALAKGADTLITAGAAQTNHGRQTAAAAAKFGLRCHLVLAGEEPPLRNGNLLLDDLLGAEVHWLEPTKGVGLPEAMKDLAGKLRAQGAKPYIIPVGGSNTIGACGYAVAMLEVLEQLRMLGVKMDRMFLASGSAGTQAGLLVGAKLGGFPGRVEGISVSRPRSSLAPAVYRLTQDTLEFLGEKVAVEEGEVIVHDGYLGAGYGRPAALEREAIRLAASYEGIILDPVYTARAFGGMLDLIRKGAIGKDESVLFWHTGGIPALFVHAQALF